MAPEGPEKGSHTWKEVPRTERRLSILAERDKSKHVNQMIGSNLEGTWHCDAKRSAECMGDPFAVSDGAYSHDCDARRLRVFVEAEPVQERPVRKSRTRIAQRTEEPVVAAISGRPEASPKRQDALQEALLQECQLLHDIEQSRCQIQKRADEHRDALAMLSQEEARLLRLLPEQEKELAAAQSEHAKLRSELEAEEAQCAKLSGRLQLKAQMATQLRRLSQQPEPKPDLSTTKSRFDAAACESEIMHLLGQSLKGLDASADVPDDLGALCASLRQSAGRFRAESAAWLGHVRQQLGLSAEPENRSAQTLILTLVETLKSHLNTSGLQGTASAGSERSPDPAQSKPRLQGPAPLHADGQRPTTSFLESARARDPEGSAKLGNMAEQTVLLLRQQEQELTACLEKLRHGGRDALHQGPLPQDWPSEATYPESLTSSPNLESLSSASNSGSAADDPSLHPGIPSIDARVDKLEQLLACRGRCSVDRETKLPVRVPEDVPLRSLWKEAQAAQSSRRAKSELPAAATSAAAPTAPAATGTSKRLDFNDDSPRRALAEEIAQTVKGRIEALCRDVPKLVGEAKVTKRANAKSDLVRPQPQQPQPQPQPQQPQASCMRQLEEQQGRLDSLLEDIQSQNLFEPQVLRTPPSKQPDSFQKQEGQSSPAEVQDTPSSLLRRARSRLSVLRQGLS
ncbi:unnamed protein product [Symbiodinium sp. CCMP2592]|nr:unnamed protein product [Symbiodinium sp. CCMP2592]